MRRVRGARFAPRFIISFRWSCLVSGANGRRAPMDAPPGTRPIGWPRTANMLHRVSTSTSSWRRIATTSRVSLPLKPWLAFIPRAFSGPAPRVSTATTSAFHIHFFLVVFLFSLILTLYFRACELRFHRANNFFISLFCSFLLFQSRCCGDAFFLFFTTENASKSLDRRDDIRPRTLIPWMLEQIVVEDSFPLELVWVTCRRWLIVNSTTAVPLHLMAVHFDWWVSSRQSWMWSRHYLLWWSMRVTSLLHHWIKAHINEVDL